MPVCKPQRGQKRNLCIGDKNHLVTIQDRNIQPPGTLDPSNQFYFTEAFVNIPEFQVWAMVKTITGETFFDDTNLERDVTHHLFVNFDTNIDAQKWVTLDDGDRLDILNAEDLDNRKTEMLLRCTNRGPSGNANNDL